MGCYIAHCCVLTDKETAHFCLLFNCFFPGVGTPIAGKKAKEGAQKIKWTKADKKSAWVNYFIGLTQLWLGILVFPTGGKVYFYGPKFALWSLLAIYLWGVFHAVMICFKAYNYEKEQLKKELDEIKRQLEKNKVLGPSEEIEEEAKIDKDSQLTNALIISIN